MNNNVNSSSERKAMSNSASRLGMQELQEAQDGIQMAVGKIDNLQ
jgi:hypothetical protein